MKKKQIKQYILYFSIFICLLTFVHYTARYKNGLAIKRVIDGDTLELYSSKRVRLIGIDTPETRRFNGVEWTEVDEPYSLEAKNFTQNFCRTGILRIEQDLQKQDKYNRILAYCFINDKMLNEELLRNGLAYLFFMQPNGKYAERLFKAHCQAVKSKKGIWSDKNNIITPKQMLKYTGKVKIICGKIENIAFSDIGYVLLWDIDNYIQVPANIAFEKASYIRSLKGQDVCAEGKIKKRSGQAFVRIFHTINIFPQKAIEN